MTIVAIYTAEYCPYCTRAKALLKKKQINYTEIRIDLHPERCDEMVEKSGKRTVPQIFINDQPIGGCDDLYALEAQGKLDQLLRG